MINNTYNTWLKGLLYLMMSILYWHITYVTKIEDFYSFITQYFILFTFFVFLIKFESNFKRLLGFAILSRVLIIFSIPELSPDFYRFIWDGELLTKGINPYQYVPNELMTFNTFTSNPYFIELFNNITDLSKGNYSNYPVLNQFLFFIPALLFDDIYYNMITLKIIILLADLGSIYFIIKILKQLKLNVSKVWLYALNPFIMIEFMGNLHFEGVMIFCLLGAIYFVMVNEWVKGSLFLGLAIQIKLIPLLFLPFFFKYLKWKKSILFLALSLLTVFAIGLFLWSNQSNFENMMKSITIYFTTFQFNSSLFGVANHYKSLEMGWDSTYVVGPFLSKIATVLIILLAMFRNFKSEVDIFKGILFALVIYYLFATTVHPWYISLILVTSIFTNYKFGLIWSLLVPLTYSFYIIPESAMFYRVLEYSVVFLVIVFELIKYKEKNMLRLNFKSFFGL